MPVEPAGPNVLMRTEGSSVGGKVLEDAGDELIAVEVCAAGEGSVDVGAGAEQGASGVIDGGEVVGVEVADDDRDLVGPGC